MPLNRLVHGRAQVGGRSARQGIEGRGGHDLSLYAGTFISRTVTRFRGWVHDLQPENLFERIEIMVPVEPPMLGLQTESGNEAIDSLADVFSPLFSL